VTLLEFLRTNEREILTSVDEKSSALGGVRPGSEQMHRALPIFLRQLMGVLENIAAEPSAAAIDSVGLVQAANASPIASNDGRVRSQATLTCADQSPSQRAASSTSGMAMCGNSHGIFSPAQE